MSIRLPRNTASSPASYGGENPNPIGAIMSKSTAMIESLAATLMSLKASPSADSNVKDQITKTLDFFSRLSKSLNAVTTAPVVTSNVVVTTDVAALYQTSQRLLDDCKAIHNALVTFSQANQWIVDSQTISPDKLRNLVSAATNSSNATVQNAGNLLQSFLAAAANDFPAISKPSANLYPNWAAAHTGRTVRISEIIAYAPSSYLDEDVSAQTDPSGWIPPMSGSSSADPTYSVDDNNYSKITVLDNLYAYWSTLRNILYIVVGHNGLNNGDTLDLLSLPVGAYRLRWYAADLISSVGRLSLSGGDDQFIVADGVSLSPAGDASVESWVLPPESVGDITSEVLSSVSTSGTMVSITNNTGAFIEVQGVLRCEPIANFLPNIKVIDAVGGYDGLPIKMRGADCWKALQEFITSNPEHPFLKRLDVVWQTQCSGYNSTFTLPNGNKSNNQASNTTALFSGPYANLVLVGPDMFFVSCPGSPDGTVPPISPANLKVIYPWYYELVLEIFTELGWTFNVTDMTVH